MRGPARELARYPDWRLRWFEDPDEVATPSVLADALLEVPMLGVPGSSFIFPIMHQAEESGIAAKLLTGVLDGDAASAGRDLARIAAWSMLQEPPDHAPYGWSHCLTMPQSVIALAGFGTQPRTAIAVAATHVVGFRAALGQRALEPDREILLDETPDLVEHLATRAALHHDAHLVKYTLACFDAAAADPSHRPLYMSAAQSLSDWWAKADAA